MIKVIHCTVVEKCVLTESRVIHIVLHKLMFYVFVICGTLESTRPKTGHHLSKFMDGTGYQSHHSPSFLSNEYFRGFRK